MFHAALVFPESLLYLIALFALLIGTYTDIKTREVPDWLNYGIIFVGIGLRALYSIIKWDYSFILYGLMGAGFFFVLAAAMFYAGQWGGGDAKMLIGLGALLGIEISLDTFMIGFVLNALLVGAIFGIIYSVYLAIIKRQAFARSFVRLHDQYNRRKRILWLATAMLLISAIFVPVRVQFVLMLLAVFVFFSYYVFLFLKSVEFACMMKRVAPEELTEGDWIVHDILVGGKRICGPKDLGISLEQIKKLVYLKKKGKIRTILIKEGIPFVPSFLIAFLVTLFLHNWLFVMLGILP